jgi:addiction module RelE/StbE family toxin
MKIAFDPDANDDLDHIFAWIAKDNPPAAYEMMARIEAHIARLATAGFEEMGRPGFVDGTQELITAPYIIVYKAFEQRDEIVIVAVVHGSQDR